MAEKKMDPPWSGLAAKCCKCESKGEEITTRWIEASSREGEERPERVERKCQNCGYSWFERPADAGNGPGG